MRLPFRNLLEQGCRVKRLTAANAQDIALLPDKSSASSRILSPLPGVTEVTELFENQEESDALEGHERR
jgi:hypothetical protein